MTARHAACNCGQLHLTIEGEPSRISMCHCLECQRRTGAVISNQARFRREQVTFAGKATAWTRTAESGNALTFHFCPTCGSTVYWEAKAFLGTSPSPSAPSPTQISPHQPLQCGRSHATPGFLYRPIRQQSAWRNRGDKAAGGLLLGRPELPVSGSAGRPTSQTGASDNSYLSEPIVHPPLARLEAVRNSAELAPRMT
jgi:hypothetical protein